MKKKNSLSQEPPQLMTVTEAVRILNVSRSLLYKLMDEGQLPFVKIGRVRRFAKDVILELATRGTEAVFASHVGHLLDVCPGIIS